MIKKLLVIGSLFLVSPVFGATICIEIPDAQILSIQKILDAENAQGKTRYAEYVPQTVNDYIQRVINPAIVSIEKRQKDEGMLKLKETLESLSIPAQQELVGTLIRKSQEEALARKAQEGVVK